MLQNLLWLCMSFSIHAAKPWIASFPKLPQVAQDLVDDYVEWHKEAGKEKRTHLLVHRPRNGLGDQMINSVRSMLHGCVLLHAEGKSLRFEISPGHGDSFSGFTGPAKDVGVWMAGIDARIDFLHDPVRAKRLKQVVEERVKPCWRGECKYFRYDHRISQVMYAMLLRPSLGTQSLLKNALPGRRPDTLIGVHLRTHVLSNSWEHRATPESLAKHNRPIFEFEPVKQLYMNAVAGIANCALEAARKSAQGQKPNAVSIFVASDYLDFTNDVEKYLRAKEPNLMVGSVPGWPRHSHGPYDTLANSSDYETVWATWFALAQSDALCVGSSMFSDSARVLRLGRPPILVEHNNKCLRLAWIVLNEFAKWVSEGSPINIKTVIQAYRRARSRTSLDDMQCFPKTLQKDLGMIPSESAETLQDSYRTDL